MLNELFAIRARSVLYRADPAANADRLSGLLIGTELLGLRSDALSGLPIIVAAPEPIRSSYRVALETIGLGDRTRLLPDPDVGRLVASGQRAILDARPSATD
jgi:2-keto-3-deoxy-galactonokinase